MHGNYNHKVYPGAKFFWLTVIERLPPEQGKHRKVYRVRCRCRCGKETTPDISAVTMGQTTSCGCRKRAAGARSAKARVKPDSGYGKVVPGAKFGRLTVIERLPDGDGRAKAKCQCSCGNEHEVSLDGLVQGITKSCGCLSREVTAARNRQTAKFQGFSKKRPKTFARWSDMMARCCNPNATAFPEYGAVGVKVCEYLRADPRHLVALIGLVKRKRNSLDRFPILDGHYSCGQCAECRRNGWKLNIRWATRKEQCRNKTTNVYLTAFGRTLTRIEWAEVSGIGTECVRKRVERGWSLEKALTTPDSFGNCYKPGSS